MPTIGGHQQLRDDDRRTTQNYAHYALWLRSLGSQAQGKCQQNGHRVQSLGEGINLGCSPKSPGGYLIWVPSINRVVNTADAYFAESHYPWRAKGDQFLGDVAA